MGTHGVAAGAEVRQDLLGAGECIHPDRVGDLVGFAGICRQNQRDPFVRSGQGGQAVPCLHTVGQRVDPRGVRTVGKARIFEIGVLLARLFEAGDTGKDAAIDFGQDHVHGKVGRGQTAIGVLPILLAGGGQGDLEHGAASRIEGRGFAVAPLGREGSRVDDGSGFQSIDLGAQPVGSSGGLETAGKGTYGLEPALFECRDHGVDGRGVGGRQVRAVEGHQSQRAVVALWIGDDACVGQVKARIRHSFRAHHGGRIKASGQRQLGQRGLGSHSATSVAQVLKTSQGRDGQGAELVQPVILTPVGGQDGQRNPLAPRQVLKGRQTVGPVAFAADQTDEDALGPLERLFGVDVNGQWMFQGHEVRQTHSRQGPLGPMVARRESAKV